MQPTEQMVATHKNNIILPAVNSGKEKGRYKKQNDIVISYANADCIDLVLFYTELT